MLYLQKIWSVVLTRVLDPAVFEVFYFVDEISEIWEIMFSAFISNNIDLKPGEGFPPNVEYRWSEGKGKAVPLRCSGIEYMHHCIKWLEGQVCDHTLFPLSDATPYPRHLKAIVEAMLVKIFRILAIARSAFFKDITRAGADRKFERLFKTFLYFCWEHHLMNPRELKAIESEVEIVRELYDRDCEARGTYHK